MQAFRLMAVAAAVAVMAGCASTSDLERAIEHDPDVVRLKSQVARQEQTVRRCEDALADARREKRLFEQRVERYALGQRLEQTQADRAAMAAAEAEFAQRSGGGAENVAPTADACDLTGGEGFVTEYRAFLEADRQNPAAVAAAKQAFVDALKRELRTDAAALKVVRMLAANLRNRERELGNELAKVERHVVVLELEISRRQGEGDLARQLLAGLAEAESQARAAAELKFNLAAEAAAIQE